MRVLDWMNGFIYFLSTPPVITRNYIAIAISTLYSLVTHTNTHTHTHTHTSSPLLLTQLKHRHYNSLTELHTPNITGKFFSSESHSCKKPLTTLHCTFNTFPWRLRVLDSRLLSCDYSQTTFVVPYKTSAWPTPTENTCHVTATQPVHWAPWLMPIENIRHMRATHCWGDAIASARKCVYQAVT
jgi:hypothetical protein